MIVAGFGFSSGASVSSLRDAYDRAAGELDIALLATAHDKACHIAFTDLAGGLKLPICAVAPKDLEIMHTRTRSAMSQSARNTGSVAEAAALAAAGPDARLVSARFISDDRRATCAIAIGGAT
ncbi:MAG: cobalamin biosynthesis protein [Pseudomonadota bacterium]